LFHLSAVKNKPKSILFVCLGNICRSPTAEGIFGAYILQHASDQAISVDSAGTIGYHQGNPADARMRQTAARHGYDLQSLSRKITPTDLESFDLVIAMDRENLQDIQQVHSAPTASIKLLSDFLDDQWPTDVPDPYYGGDEGFEYVVDMIAAAVPKIYEHLIQTGDTGSERGNEP
jgi:protein-tyrosine phosphatase